MRAFGKTFIWYCLLRVQMFKWKLLRVLSCGTVICYALLGAWFYRSLSPRMKLSCIATQMKAIEQYFHGDQEAVYSQKCFVGGSCLFLGILFDQWRPILELNLQSIPYCRPMKSVHICNTRTQLTSDNSRLNNSLSEGLIFPDFDEEKIVQSD